MSDTRIDEQSIKEMLDTLADWKDRRNLMESDRLALLDEVKVPAEVEAIEKANMNRMMAVDSKYAGTPYEDEYYDRMRQAREKADAALAQIVIPEEIKLQLAEIDRQREVLIAERDDEIRQNNDALELLKSDFAELARVEKVKIMEEGQAQTREVYAALARRKSEIEEEFRGKTAAIDANILTLTEDIRTAVLELKKPVAGRFLRMKFAKGKKTWKPKELEEYTESHPDIKGCYTEGDPYTVLEKV